MNTQKNELIIIGTGPAGLTASIYASRYNIEHLVLGTIFGGTITLASEVENYPGFPHISGPELGQKFLTHAQELGATVKNEEVVEIQKEKGGFLLRTRKNKYQTKAVIIATGTERRHLSVPGEGKYLGRGVSYCSTCDAPFYKEKIVAVAGGANAACMAAIHLVKFAKKVYLIYRRDHLRGEPAWVNQIKKEPKIEVIYNTNVTAILGDDNKVTHLKLDHPHQGKETLAADGIFIEIGGVPMTALAKAVGVKTDKDNFIITNKMMATNVPGIFCAGDINSSQKHHQQVITAASEGAIAALGVYKYLHEK